MTDADWQLVEYLKDKLHLGVRMEWSGGEDPEWVVTLTDHGHRPFQTRTWEARHASLGKALSDVVYDSQFQDLLASGTKETTDG
jgi:hypothetical protein